jgi:hypothetical protein
MHIKNYLMDRFLILALTVLITGCGVGGMPTNVNLTCNDLLGFPDDDFGSDYPIVSEDLNTEITFKANKEANTLEGSDGSSTKFHSTDGVDHAFVNFDETGSVVRVINIYPVDMEMRVEENGNIRRLSCKGSPD